MRQRGRPRPGRCRVGFCRDQQSLRAASHCGRRVSRRPVAGRTIRGFLDLGSPRTGRVGCRRGNRPLVTSGAAPRGLRRLSLLGAALFGFPSIRSPVPDCVHDRRRNTPPGGTFPATGIGPAVHDRIMLKLEHFPVEASSPANRWSRVRHSGSRWSARPISAQALPVFSRAAGRPDARSCARPPLKGSSGAPRRTRGRCGRRPGRGSPSPCRPRPRAPCCPTRSARR